MDCRATSAHKFRKEIRFKQCDVILTKEKSVMTKVMSWFEEESMQTQHKKGIGQALRIKIVKK